MLHLNVPSYPGRSKRAFIRRSGAELNPGTILRLVLIFLCALLVLSCGIAATASRFDLMQVGRALFGIGLGGFWALALAISPLLVEKKHVPRATAAI